jgi:hypothetical protein
MMRVLTVSTFVAAVLVPAIDADAAPGATCPSRKVSATAKKVDRKLKCHEKAASIGTAVDPVCLTIAEAKFTDAFSKAEGSPPCFATGDAATIEGSVDAFVDGLVATLRPSATASRCAGRKLKASRKKAAKLLACHKQGIQQGTKPSVVCLGKVPVKFNGQFAAAEEGTDCLTSGDAAATETTIDAFVDAMMAALRPVTPSKCTSFKLAGAGRKGREKLICHGKAADDGGAADPSCLADAEEDFDVFFVKGESLVDCYTTGDAAAVEALVDATVASIEAQLRPSLTPSKCALGKFVLASRAYEGVLKCRATSIDDGLPLIPECVATDTQQITLGFPKVEGEQLDCLTTGDASAVLATVSAGVSSVEGALIP